MRIVTLFAITIGTAVCGSALGAPASRSAAQPFDLREVRLLEGPFRDAQERNKGYVLRVEVDRLMHWWRVNNGLPSAAKPYGEWKPNDYGFQGHYEGHYLSACAEMLRSTGDARFKERLDQVVAVIAEAQSAKGSGFIAPFPEQWLRIMAGLEPRPAGLGRIPVPWYALHKVYQGLLDAYALAENRQALDIMLKAAAWLEGYAAQISDEAFQRMLDEEHGGINEALANLYAVTGDLKHLALAQRFCHRRVLEPLARGEDVLDGLHANTQVPKFTGFARLHELCGDPACGDAARHFWRFVTEERSYANGGNSDREHFTPKARLSRALSGGTCETCNTHNMLKLTRCLFRQAPAAATADYTERALLNHILSSQSPESGTVTYFHPLEGGSRKGFGPSWPNFGCCHASGMENHAKYGDSIYFKRGAERLFVNLFIASEVTWKEAGLTVRQATRFPEEQATALTVACAKPVRATLSIRRPGWAGAGFAVSVNGQPVPAKTGPEGYVDVTRDWRGGDTVSVALPMALRWEGFKDNPARAALLFGPVLLVARADEGCRTATVLKPAGRALAALKPADKPLHFDADPALFRRDVTEKPVHFQPLYQTVRDCYTVYWDEQDEAQRAAALRAYDAEAARWTALAPMTVDVAFHDMATPRGANSLPGRFAADASLPRTPGADRTEQQHALEAQTGYNSELNLLQFPAAGLWQTFRTVEKGMDRFGWTLSVEPGKAQTLRVRLWSPPAGDPEARRATACGLEVRVAAIKAAALQADGAKQAGSTEGNQFAAAQAAQALPPLTTLGAIGPAPAEGAYREVTFAIPAALVADKDRLIVRFVRQKDKAPGLVGEVRIIRDAPQRLGGPL
jgi:DUF1680 family protein